jgi:hypothetical protein
MVSDITPPKQHASLANIAPLEDEEMLGAVLRGFTEVVIPELEQLGADEFVIAQTRSLMSVVGFVRRGLYERQIAREQCGREVGSLGSSSTPDPATLENLRRILRTRLDADVIGRTTRDSAQD